MSDTPVADANEETAEELGLEGGNYEIIRKRLVAHGRTLAEKAERLNTRRQEVFGTSSMDVVGSVRVRTANNCIPRDIVNVGGKLLFGYNVFVGLREQIKLEEVFFLSELHENDGEFEVEPVPFDDGDAYLKDPKFLKNFSDLYQYNKDSFLQILRVENGRLLAVFQIGRTVKDIRVFNWSVSPQGEVQYIDDRGDRFHTFPASHDFVWTETVREDFRYGEHPHISIKDRIFVECVGGDLTVKVENNTSDGLGIYREDVEDHHQALNDAEIQYAELGTHLILMRIKPYREEEVRYLAYSALTHKVQRIDAIGVACVQLPENHGIIFPGGIFLTNGEFKAFDHNVDGLEFKRVIRSPNGEDVLYLFHRRDEGTYVLLQYNLIRKEILNPILCHGYSIFDDGKMVVMRAQKDPTMVHQMQIWQTPFMSDAVAAAQPTDGSFVSKLGNADLVRGISDCLSLNRGISNQQPTVQIYEDLIAQATRTLDAYHWLDRDEVGDLAAQLKEIRTTADLIIDEFEKVQALRKQAIDALTDAEEIQSKLIARLRPEYWEAVENFVKALGELRTQRGHLITLKELRYINLARIDELEAQIIEKSDALSRDAVGFLLKDEALQPYFDEITEIETKIDAVETVVHADPLRERLEEMSVGLDLLTEIVGGLQIDDATARTRILEGISEVFAQLNRTKALLEAHRKSLLGKESIAEFGAQFKLFGQSVTSGLGLADTPEKCDDQLSRLLIQLEELESRFSEFDEFLVDLASKREEVYEAFESRKQGLMEERQRRADNMAKAATRILQGIMRRAGAFKEDDALNTYFASDAMVLKVRDISEKLRALGDTVKADDIDARLKAARDQALRSLRDKKDIYEDGASVIRFGRHRFSVNTQDLELTMLSRDDHMVLHLAGTEFFERIDDPELEATRDYWSQHLVSERKDVYRGEYLAYTILSMAETGQKGYSMAQLHEATRGEGSDALLKLVRTYAAERYDEGYDRGIHDADAARILERLLHLRDTGGLLRFAATPRAAACLFWAFGADQDRKQLWHRRARSLGRLRASLGHVQAMIDFGAELAEAITVFATDEALDLSPAAITQAGEYLAEELTADVPRFVTSAEADRLKTHLLTHLDGLGERSAFDADLRALEHQLGARLELVTAWLRGLLSGSDQEKVAGLSVVLPEAAALLLTERALDRDISSAMISAEVTELLGQHTLIKSRNLPLRLDEFLPRLTHFVQTRVPGYHNYRKMRQSILERERERLRLSEYMPRVLTSFVRNRLISEVYLPMVGDNLAKQMGALGDQKRTDLMGLLLLISPPGYGKTTLMEYIANRLGLIFMKINGPALGHSVTSLDPSEAPNATAAQELLKLNLALEMGNNVMLYLDDIQHTHPEFLQKFISLCDAQRRIEGVWKGRTRTYDLRGKKFCVIMAGNPYTESGEKFQIPDMLSNRADTYNLGDILDGRDEVFALSYLENTLTSNPVLQPLATRDPADTYKLFRLARGEDIPVQELKYNYSAVEVNEITAVLKKLFAVQDVLLKVNLTYISSASQDDAYRTEPPFKLQGSYRNMNKVAEKVVSAMNEVELEALIDDHYIGEAQTLTTGAEMNLLKLAELRGRMNDEDKARWDDIKKEFTRRRMMGGADDDPVQRVTGQLSAMVQEMEGIRAGLSSSPLAVELSGIKDSLAMAPLTEELSGIRKSMALTELGDQLGGIRDAMQGTATAQKLDLLRQAVEQNSLKTSLQGIEKSIDLAAKTAAAQSGAQQHVMLISTHLKRIVEQLEALSSANMSVQIVNQPSKGLEEMLAQQVDIVEWTLVPLVRTMAQDLQGGREIWERLNEVLARLKATDPRTLNQPQVVQQQQTVFTNQEAAAPQQQARPARATPQKPAQKRPAAKAPARPKPSEDPLTPQKPKTARGPQSGVIRNIGGKPRPKPTKTNTPTEEPTEGRPTMKLPPVKGPEES